MFLFFLLVILFLVVFNRQIAFFFGFGRGFTFQTSRISDIMGAGRLFGDVV